MKDESYQGWTNHLTWIVNLWLENEERSYHETAALCSAQYIRDYVEEEMIPQSLWDHGMCTDLIRSALDDVNWNEIYDAIHADDLEEEDRT